MPIFVFSVTAPFKLYSLPELELDSPLTVLEPEPDLTSIIGSSLLSCVKHLRSTLRTLILTSLPVYWAKWIAQNVSSLSVIHYSLIFLSHQLSDLFLNLQRLTVGLMCVSVMYGCTLCPLLYYLWTQTQSNKRLVLKLKTVNGMYYLSSGFCCTELPATVLFMYRTQVVSGINTFSFDLGKRKSD